MSTEVTRDVISSNHWRCPLLAISKCRFGTLFHIGFRYVNLFITVYGLIKYPDLFPADDS